METFFRHLPTSLTDRFCATQIIVEQITPTTNATTTKETAVTEATAATKVQPHQNRWRRKENCLERCYRLTLKSSFIKCGNSVGELQASTQGDTQTTKRQRCSSLQINRVHHEEYWPLALTLALALLVCNIGQMVAASPVFVDNPTIPQFQSGRNIRHLPCIVRKSGRSGVCMFAIDCIKRNGTHLGTCIDRFYFGSCCQMQDESVLYPQEISDNSIDQNTISHFAHDSTTLPTNAAFKLTTENANHVTNREASTFNSSSAHSTDMPIPSTSSFFRPTTDTVTHKISQFVVRTTNKPKPSLNPKPTIEPITFKPPKRRTTTRPVVLTTASPKVEESIKTTTLPEKFSTLQTIETTTGSAIEAINDILAVDMWTATARPRPSVGTHISPMNRSTTRHPTITKKPAFTNTPTPKIPLRPNNDTGTFIKPPTTALPVVPTSFSDTQKTTSIITNITTTRSSAESTTTTVAPTTAKTSRPKPKPTAEILKVPRPTLGVSKTTAIPAPTTTTTTTRTTTMKRPIETTQIDDGPNKPATVLQLQPTTSTSAEAELSTTTTNTTEQLILRPTTTTESTPVKSTTSTTETSGDPTPTTTKTVTSTVGFTPAFTTTTELPKVVTSTIGTTSSTTTIRPELVTWANIAGDIFPNMTIDMEWQPRPPPPDWVPLPTIAPVTQVNKTTIPTTTTTNFDASQTEAPESGTTQKTVIVSITSSSGDSENNASASNELESVANYTTDATASIIPSSPPTTTAISTTTDKQTNESAGSELMSSTANATDLHAASTANGTHVNITSTSEDGSSNATTASPLSQWEGVDYRQICGRRMFPEPRIVGGSNAAFGRWPWQISLRQWRTSTYLHKCGAALLNENWAITAAHCVDNVPPSDLLMRLGEYDLAEEEEPYSYQERRVQIVASHPQFDPRTFEYDLALLRFYEPVIFQPNIIPVCIPDSDNDFIGQTAFVTGWGRLYEDGPLPSVLQEVAVPVISNTICEAMYRDAGYIEHIPHVFICAGWKKGGYDSCEGDSGGPLVLQREEDKRFQLGGIISWGFGCAEVNQPGVYTRISEFRDWINQILQF